MERAGSSLVRMAARMTSPVDRTGNGQEALAAFEGTYKAILVDIQMLAEDWK